MYLSMCLPTLFNMYVCSPPGELIFVSGFSTRCGLFKPGRAARFYYTAALLNCALWMQFLRVMPCGDKKINVRYALFFLII